MLIYCDGWLVGFDVVVFMEVVEYVDLFWLVVFEVVVFDVVWLWIVVVMMLNVEWNVWYGFELGCLWYVDYWFEWIWVEFGAWVDGVGVWYGYVVWVDGIGE